MLSDTDENEIPIPPRSLPAAPRTIHQLTIGLPDGSEKTIKTPNPAASLTHEAAQRLSVLTSGRSEFHIFWDRIAWIEWTEIDIPAEKPKPEPAVPTRSRPISTRL